MENKLIQITDKILGVIVDAEYTRFMIDEIDFYQGQFLLAAKEKGSYSVIKSFDDKHKIHGTCTLPLFDFDFEVTDKMASCSSSCSQSDYHKGGYCDRNGCYGKDKKGMFANKIQKAIQDEGMFVVNPYGENKPQELVDYTGRKDGIIANSLELEQWKSSESKTVKKLLIIEKN